MTSVHTTENSNMNNEVFGTIFGIQHFSIHDGPGIRTTVFLKGCPLNCLWCHNPEGISVKQELSFTSGKCVSCGTCYKNCPDVHKLVNGEHSIDRGNCKLCGKCIKDCCGSSLEIIGKETSAEEIIKNVSRDKRYYEISNGGVTFSGGEPMLQFEFLYSLLKKAKADGIHTAVETSGYMASECYRKILPLVDLFLFDFKESDPVKHREYTGADNGLILKNLEMLHDADNQIILRCPVIPGLNNRTDHFSAIAAVTARLPNLLGAEIMAYHKLGADKNRRIGRESQKVYEQPGEKEINDWKDIIRQHGGKLIENS